MDASTSNCLPCPVGSYGDKLGQSSCEVCPPLTNTTGTGKTSPTECRGMSKEFHKQRDCSTEPVIPDLISSE